LVGGASKTRIGRDQAQLAIEAAFDSTVWLAASAECEEGWFNAVYRLELSDGRTVVLKVAPPPGFRAMRYEHKLMDTEVSMLRLVGENTEVPVPEVLFWDESCTVLPSPYFVMETCQGTLMSELRPRLDDAAQQVIDAQVARHVASINAIAAPAFGRPDPMGPHRTTWSTAFDDLVAEHLADAKDADVELPFPPDELVSLVKNQAPHLDVVTEPRVVHWDLWDSNVFVDSESLDVVGLIDFERVLWADPLMEVQFLGKRESDGLVAAYGMPLFDQPYAVERRRLYDLYLYLVMFIECAYRNYPTDDIEKLARACLPVILEELANS
jgi:aminoglycoside phosphotransferase (APT) family kinase protein